MLVTQAIFKEIPDALRDPFARIAKDFDPKLEFPPEFGSVAQLRLDPEQTVITVATQRAAVRIDNPENDDEAVAKALAAWERLQNHLKLEEVALFSARMIFVADRSSTTLLDLVSEFRRHWQPPSGTVAEAINLALVVILPAGERLRRRFHVGPGEASHLLETFQLTVPERAFYWADVDHLLGRNVPLSTMIRRSHLAPVLRTNREYAEDLTRAIGAEEAADGGG